MNKSSLYNLDKVIRELDTYFRDAPGNIFLKDKDGIILYGNKNICHCVGVDDFGVMVGKKDSELLDSAESISSVRKNDRLTLSLGKEIDCEEQVKLIDGGITTFTVRKKPFFHKDKIIGIWGTSIAVSSVGCSEVPIAYLDCRTNELIKLTNRQKVCMSHLLQGKTAKEIAEAMLLSVRTIENYIYNIRLNNNIKSMKSLLPYIKAVY